MKKTIYNRLSGIVLLSILFYGLSISSIAQGILVKSPTILKVTSGTKVIEPVNLSMESGASIDNSGTIILKGNLVNQNVSQSNMGTGTFEFSGTSHQYIIGLNKMNNVTVNNSKGVGILGNTEVDGVLTMTSGLVTLGSNNLLLGPDASVSGTPTATNMVMATGSGLLQKQFSDGTGARNFTYPVGDSTGTAGYSPVTLNFTTGNFATGIAGVKLVNSAYSGMTGDYLNRYWNLSQSGITSFTCSAQFNYIGGAYPATGDVTGTEANIYCLKVDPDLVIYDAANTSSHYLTASGLTGFGTFTGGPGALATSFTVFLEGPYSSGAMTTNLRTLGLIPLTQPYTGSPWNYSGTESVGSIPAGVVDWVLIDLRQAASPDLATSSTSIGKRAAFLKSDGTIVDIDGTSSVSFNGASVTSNLYPVIFHRNHLAIMANSAVTKTSGIYTYDFSSGQTQIYDGSGYGCIHLGTKWGMIAANANGDGSISVADRNIWRTDFGTEGYDRADFTLDGSVSVADRNKWRTNFGCNTVVP